MTILVFIGSLLGLMALGMPIAFALIGCGLAMMYHMGVTDPQIVIQNMWDGSNSFPLLAVPFFMLAGEFMNAGGMTRRIINMAMALDATHSWPTNFRRSDSPFEWALVTFNRSSHAPNAPHPIKTHVAIQT